MEASRREETLQLQGKRQISSLKHTEIHSPLTFTLCWLREYIKARGRSIDPSVRLVNVCSSSMLRATEHDWKSTGDVTGVRNWNVSCHTALVALFHENKKAIVLGGVHVSARRVNMRMVCGTDTFSPYCACHHDEVTCVCGCVCARARACAYVSSST